MFDPHPPCYERSADWFSSSSRILWAAVQLCKRCAHQDPCKEIGESEHYGVWGGELRDSPTSSVAVNYRKFTEEMEIAAIDLERLRVRLAQLNKDILDDE